MEATREMIEALSNEAGEHGDYAQVELCTAALSGDQCAWAKCEAAIASARAQDDAPDYYQDGWDAAQVAFEANELRKMPPVGLLGDIEALPHQRAAAEEKFTQGWVEFAAEMA